MFQKLPVNISEWIENTSTFNKDFKKGYNEESDEYPKKIHELYNDLPFLPERMKIKKIKKLVINLHDKNVYIIQISNITQALSLSKNSFEKS